MLLKSKRTNQSCDMKSRGGKYVVMACIAQTLFVCAAKAGFENITHSNGANVLITEIDGKVFTDVEQTARIADISAEKFSVFSNEEVKVNALSPSDLLRISVFGSDPTTFEGKFTSNAKVAVYNQNGIYVMDGAVIDVAGLIADARFYNKDGFDPQYAHTALGAGSKVVISNKASIKSKMVELFGSDVEIHALQINDGENVSVVADKVLVADVYGDGSLVMKLDGKDDLSHLLSIANKSDCIAKQSDAGAITISYGELNAKNIAAKNSVSILEDANSKIAPNIGSVRAKDVSMDMKHPISILKIEADVDVKISSSSDINIAKYSKIKAGNRIDIKGKTINNYSNDSNVLSAKSWGVTSDNYKDDLIGSLKPDAIFYKDEEYSNDINTWYYTQQDIPTSKVHIDFFRKNSEKSLDISSIADVKSRIRETAVHLNQGDALLEDHLTQYLSGKDVFTKFGRKVEYQVENKFFNPLKIMPAFDEAFVFTKEYDGNYRLDTSNLEGRVILRDESGNGIADGVVGVQIDAAVASSKDVGDKIVSAAYLSLKGENAVDYELDNSKISFFTKITPKAIDVEGVEVRMMFNGRENDVREMGLFKVNGVVGNDEVEVVREGLYRDAGKYDVIGELNNKNYVAKSEIKSALIIERAEIGAVIKGVKTKEYDGTVMADAVIEFDGNTYGADVEIKKTDAFYWDQDAGNKKTVTAQFELLGMDANNFKLVNDYAVYDDGVITKIPLNILSVSTQRNMLESSYINLRFSGAISPEEQELIYSSVSGRQLDNNLSLPGKYMHIIDILDTEGVLKNYNIELSPGYVEVMDLSNKMKSLFDRRPLVDVLNYNANMRDDDKQTFLSSILNNNSANSYSFFTYSLSSVDGLSIAEGLKNKFRYL